MKSIFSKKQLTFKLLFSLLFLAILIFFFKAWENITSLIYFTSAYFLGLILLLIDELFLYRFYTDKIDMQENSSSHNPLLASRNLMFLLALPFLSIFVVTSSGSLFGIAFVLALNFYLLVEIWQLRSEPLLFTDRFLVMSKIEVSNDLVKKICWVVLAYFVFLLIALLF